MKHFPCFLAGLALIFSIMGSFDHASALCMPDPDWPDAPCYGRPSEQPTTEQLRKDWSGYYDYKGKEWMESKKMEMDNAFKTGTISDWLDHNKSTNYYANYNIFYYYRLQGDISPLKQFQIETSAENVWCGDDFIPIIKSTDGSPACVTYNTGESLITRGWAACSEHINYGREHPCGPHTRGVISFDSKQERENKLNLSTECETEFRPKALQHTVFTNGTSLTVNYIPVFLMKSNSTGKICTTNWKAIQYDNYSVKVSAGIGNGYSASQDISIVPNQDYITIDDTNKTITYTITAPKESHGFYRINPMFFNCGGLPLAVGYDESHSFDNDFPWLDDRFPCPFPSVNVQITGLSEIDVAYIIKVSD